MQHILLYTVRKWALKGLFSHLLLISSLIANAQSNIIRIEYYIDADPGYGNATPLSFSPTTQLTNLSIPIDPAILTSGVHQFGVRAKDANGAWSLDNRWLFFKPYSNNSTAAPLPNLSYVEYYIDTDPGYGNGTAVPVGATTNASNLLINIDPAILTSGVHQFGVRAKDANGAWSLDNRWLFFKPYSNNSTAAPLPNLSYVEYYIDTDLGYGNGTAVPVGATTNASNLLINIDPATLTSGVHQFGVRAKDANGAWSLDNRWLFIKPYSNSGVAAQVPNLVYLEYYIDNDPGMGAGIPVSIPASKDLNGLGISVKLDTLTAGSHKFFIRARDSNGSWSLVNRLDFNIPPSFDQTLKITGTVPLSLCRDSAISISYTATGTYNSANQFTLQLSDTSGSFATSVTLGIVTANTSGIINGTIPENTPGGTRYRIRIVSSDPNLISTDNGQDITIGYTAAITCPQNITVNADAGQCSAIVNFAATGDGVITYSHPPGGSFPVGITTVTATATNSCGPTNCQFTITVNDIELPVAKCKNASITLNQNGTASVTGNDINDASTDNCGIAIVTISPNTFTAVNIGNNNITMTVTDVSGNTNTCTAVVTVNPYVAEKQDQTISLIPTPDKEFGSAKFKVLATASSGLPVSLNIVTQPAGIANLVNDSITIAGIGEVIINAIQEGNNSYSAAAPVADTFRIIKATQKINFPIISDKVVTDSPFVVSATSSSGLPVTLTLSSIPSDIVKLSNDTITILGAGTVTVKAIQSGNDNYNPAPSVETSFTINQENITPDLVIDKISISAAVVSTAEPFNYQLEVKNIGTATAVSGVLVRGYLSSDNILDNSDIIISEDTLSSSITAGQVLSISKSIQAPVHLGQYQIIFQVNPTEAIKELLYSNNSSEQLSLQINPAYTVNTQVSLQYFSQGTTIPISGNAQRNDGSPAPNVPVEVHVLTNNLKRKITATTDETGAFNVNFVPLANESGHYTISGTFPEVEPTTQQSYFDILGVQINGGTMPQLVVVLNDTLKGSLTIQNLSNTALTDFTLASVNLPNGASVNFETIPFVTGKSTIDIKYKVAGSVLTSGSIFEVANLQAVAKEGIIQKADIFYYCQAASAFIVSDVSNLNITASASKGERIVELKLINNGRTASGNIAINLPSVNWIKTVTPSTLPSIATGDTAIAVLKFIPSSEVPFNYPITGTIGISSEKGNSFSIPFSFEKVSEAAGILQVTVTNQFTYFSEGAPKVKGAHVQIKNYFTGELYSEGYTDSSGVFEGTGIPEGKHRIIVEKEKHLPYNSTITIDPGKTTATTILLNYQAITFIWTVEPTGVQDDYKITLVTKFETHVPMPVVTIEMPKTMPQLSGDQVYAFNVTLTNHGLITANYVQINLPANDPEYEFVTNYIPGDLLAQQSIQVPVVMRRRTSTGMLRLRPFLNASFAGISQIMAMQTSEFQGYSGSLPCQDIVYVLYSYICNSTGLWQRTGELFSFTGRSCVGSGGGLGTREILIGGGGFPYNGNGIYFGGGSGGGTGTGTTPTYSISKTSCVECIVQLIKTTLNCSGHPVAKVGSDLIRDSRLLLCVIDATKNNDWVRILDCTSKYVVKRELIDPVIPSCYTDILRTVMMCGNTSTTSALKKSMSFANPFSTSMLAFSTQENGSGLGEAFDQLFYDMEVIQEAAKADKDLSLAIFGDLVLFDSWQALYPLLQTYIETQLPIDSTSQVDIITAMAGYELDISMLGLFFKRWNYSLEAYNKGIYSPNLNYPDILDLNLIEHYADILSNSFNYILDRGFGSIYDFSESTFNSLNDLLDLQSKAVCASVTVQLSQKLTMTREAFEGTLEIFNGHPTDDLDSLSVHIQISDSEGTPSNNLFEIQTKSLTNLLDITGTGTISAQAKGSVKFLFIPTIGAAPSAPKQYNFSGFVKYWDPYTQGMVTLPLAAVPLTVNPSPNLMLHYFMERNIISDDPLTKEVVEPTIPAELAVMVENQGYGSAVNMTISSAQPKIIENEKGLAIHFSLIGSNFQGLPKNLGLTDINFGSIPGLQTRIGQWYFTSTLLGKFVSYEASVVHENSFGNPELSLVKGIKLHELTKSIRLYGDLEDGINDFLVNDMFDAKDIPDVIYFSQGNRTEKVYSATSGSFSLPVSAPTFTNTLFVTPSEIGWNYIKLNDSGNNLYELVSVTRSDGQVIPLNNAWLTFVTLPVSSEPVYENKFHFVDHFPTTEQVSYTVVWKGKNLDVPEIVEILGAPTEVSSTPVENLQVVFNKAIDPATFTYEDLTLNFQGGANIMNNSVAITQINATTFRVNISNLTTGNGFYSFTVQAAEIADTKGVKGLAGKQVTWSQFLTFPTVQAFQGLPTGYIASSFDTIQVLFNLPIDDSSVTPDRFIITHKGLVQTGSINIDSVRADKKLFYLSGLKNILTNDGLYEFTVDLLKINSSDNVYGVKSQSITLTVDKTGPFITKLEKSNLGGVDEQHFPSVNIEFNENVQGFDISSIQLLWNGEELPLSIMQLSSIDSKSWIAGNFEMLTYYEGEYTFKVDCRSVKDGLGNTGNDSVQISWVVSRSSTQPKIIVVDTCNYSVLTAYDYSGDIEWSTGDTSKSIWVTTPGVYQLKQIINGHNVSEVTATANPKVPPSQPQITISGTTNICEGETVTLISSLASHYQWYNNDEKLSGDTLQTYIGNRNGQYKVEITNDSSCYAKSNAVSITVTSLDTYYQDQDSDGYGNSAVSIQNCTLPIGYVENKLDCNDSDNTIYPGAPELCDGKDNNCSSQVDENVKTIFYRDADGDGYGNPNSTIEACTAPTGYVIISGDCIDNDAAINPGSIEICGNNIDENCDMQADEGCNNTLLVSIENVTVFESMGVAELTIRLSRLSDIPVSVNYKTSDGSARSKGNRNNPKDYTSQSGTITIPAGTLFVNIHINIDMDNLQEPTKVFYVDLSKPTNAGIGQKRAIVTILDGSPQTIAKKQTEILHESIDRFYVRALPNPSQNYFTIITRSNSNIPVTIKVVDILGRSVERKQNINANSTLMIGHQYQPGVYMVEVIQGKERQILRLVKVTN